MEKALELFFICHYTFLIYHRQNLCRKKCVLFRTYYRTDSRNDRIPCPAQVNGNQSQLILEPGPLLSVLKRAISSDELSYG